MKDLTWYLTEGISYFERSTFGAMLDQLVFASYGSRVCPRCDGFGVVDEPWTGHDDQGNAIQFPTGANCRQCHGEGHLVFRLPQAVREITCRPTSSRHESNREAPPDAVLTRYACVTRRLVVMGPRLSAALCRAYGDEGEGLSATVRGRAWAVAPMTRAGVKLLAHARDGGKGITDPYRAVQTLTELAQLDGSNPLRDRTELLRQAAEEAGRLLARAESAWRAGERKGRAA